MYSKEKVLEILRMFCSDSCRVKDPFVQVVHGVDCVIATENHILAIYKSTEGFDGLTRLDKPNVGDLVSFDNESLRPFSVKEFFKVMSEIPLIENALVTCPECGGAGMVDWNYCSKRAGNTFTMEHECPVCDGRGEVVSDKKELDGDYTVCISGNYFSPRLLDTVKNALSMLDEDEFKYMVSEDKSLHIESKDFVFVVAPFLSPDVDESKMMNFGEVKC